MNNMRIRAESQGMSAVFGPSCQPWHMHMWYIVCVLCTYSPGWDATSTYAVKGPTLHSATACCMETTQIPSARNIHLLVPVDRIQGRFVGGKWW